MRILRYTRKKGGKYLGEGSKGTVYNFGCVSKGDSFCSKIKNEQDNIESINLYTPNGIVKLVSQRDINDFIQYSDTIKDKVAKIMKPYGKHKRGIDYELLTNIRLSKMFGSKLDKYTNIGLCKFRQWKFVGCVIEYINLYAPIYVSFSDKCEKADSMNLDKLIVDITEALQYMDKIGVDHSDIKPENMMLCDTTYKLIDWGNAATREEKIIGGLMTGILKEYLLSKNSNANKAEERFLAKIARNYPDLARSYIFRVNFHRMKNEFNSISHQGPEALEEHYRASHDFFAFGLSIMYFVVEGGLPYEKYRPIIEMLTSYLTVPTAARVYRLAKRL